MACSGKQASEEARILELVFIDVGARKRTPKELVDLLRQHMTGKRNFNFLLRDVHVALVKPMQVSCLFAVRETVPDQQALGMIRRWIASGRKPAEVDRWPVDHCRRLSVIIMDITPVRWEHPPARKDVLETLNCRLTAGSAPRYPRLIAALAKPTFATLDFVVDNRLEDHHAVERVIEWLAGGRHDGVELRGWAA